MSQGESGATGGGAGVTVGHKKIRRKRKELDALVSEEKTRRKTPTTSHQDLLGSDSDDDFSRASSKRTRSRPRHMGNFWGCLKGYCLFMILLLTLVGVAAGLRLLMLTRRELDALHLRMNSVEVSSSELPEKFHLSHLHLQEIEKNQSTVWTEVHRISSSLENISGKVNELEASLKSLRSTLMDTPQLTSLPKNVADLQDSVSKFGSTLQDIQFEMKAVKAAQDIFRTDAGHNSEKYDEILESLHSLNNEIHINSSDVQSRRIPVSEIIRELQEEVSVLVASLEGVNSTLISHVLTAQNHSLKTHVSDLIRTEISNLSQSMADVKEKCLQTDDRLWLNVTSDISQLKAEGLKLGQLIQLIQNSVDVVTGVETKLKGSQVQLASSVSELKQQLQKMEQKLSSVVVSSLNSDSQHMDVNHSRKKRFVSPRKREDGR